MKKKLILFIFITLLLIPFFSCSNKKDKEKKYNDDFIVNIQQYEPIDVGVDDNFILSFDLLGIPKEGIRAADWDTYDIKLRCKYNDNTIKDYPLKVVNIPLEMRHYLGEVGKHNLNLLQLHYDKEFEINIIENPNWDGFTCDYFDRNKKLLYSEKVGFYGKSEYKGKEIPLKEEDENYVYEFTGWKYDTNYISQDMQFIATYDQIEKLNYPVKPYQKSYVPIAAMIDEEGKNGSVLIYLGRINRVSVIYGDSVELDNDDIEIKFPQDKFDYPAFFQNFNEEIVKKIEYVNMPEYSLNIYGNPSGIISIPNFAQSFDSRYNYNWDQKVYLENKEDVTISRKEPFEYILTNSFGYLGNVKTITKADNKGGYYRLAVICSIDVYVSVSVTRIGEDQFEIGSYNEFIMAPVSGSFTYDVQYSNNNIFDSPFDNKLELTSEGLYNSIRIINWGNWE